MEQPWDANLTKELLWLRDEVSRLSKIESLYKGLITELHVREIMPGSQLTKLYSQNGDITNIDGSTIEIKFSSNHGKGKYTRWSWHKILGRHNKKHFDKLLLVGQFGDTYKYFMFDFANIPKLLMRKTKHNTWKIDARYSERPGSIYSMLLAPNEWFPK